jgi:hypothetical protein
VEGAGLGGEEGGGGEGEGEQFGHRDRGGLVSVCPI